MSRIKISVPNYFTFSTSLNVRITDVNYGGHVGNDALLGLIHEARMQFLKHHGFSEMDMGGIGLIMVDAAIEFKNESFYGDKLKASVLATEFTRVSFDLIYKLENESNGKIIAIAKTGMICFDYIAKKITAVPGLTKRKLETFP